MCVQVVTPTPLAAALQAVVEDNSEDMGNRHKGVNAYLEPIGIVQPLSWIASVSC
jgi:hypothetical protein